MPVHPTPPGIPRRRLLGTAAATLLAVGLVVTAAPAALAAPAAGGPLTDRAFVGVSVATVWTSPTSPREMDRSAVAAPADPADWLGSMTAADRRELTTASRTQTQVLYGAQVQVLERREGWTKIAVPGQPSAKDARGYPGWVPSAQLTTGAAFAGLLEALPAGTVDGVATTWLYSEETRTDRLREISAGTRLPVLAGDSGGVQVSLPDGGTAWADAAHLRIGDPGPASGEDLVGTARLFLERPYLWGGRSGFAPDCSGLTGLVHELHGITIGRDASDQATAGRAVEQNDLRPGDLLFWNSPATHVAIYAGDGRMIEAFDASTPVRITPVRFDATYSGARRHLPDPA
ncbi:MULTISPECIES: C40 family peptidase [Pseudonocardia]|uniref:Gamma-D-glutamyl-L-lysine endopeptidase n=2 Tax=Pseudonocardia TaxID=1847 RepID=A0A1Y2N617_PSEAH|nr:MULTISPECIES: NlpC/P60 family protein [Pseudonocardia]OSY42902.1 Gamma-D-glutamyl-L-lysine endopeptidase [Pseudonocardia autotrophica]TDN77479.1 NlpC/P60 family protein [Pseudonocardia autotrophica]BBG01502.1 peptidase P60 [Pseudonocardia autotrophica]GEC25286.1 peptidase P60 [Pseudonocardia saturnea]